MMSSILSFDGTQEDQRHATARGRQEVAEGGKTGLEHARMIGWKERARSTGQRFGLVGRARVKYFPFSA